MSLRNLAVLLLIASGFGACRHKSASQPGTGCFGSQIFFDLQKRPVNSFANPLRKADVFCFLSPDCPLCQGYSPLLKKLGETYNTGQFAFYAVFPGSLYTRQEIAAFLESYQLASLAVVCDTSFALTHCLGATITPEVVVTDTAGNLIYKGRIDDQAWETGQKRGLATKHDLEDLLSNLAKGKRAAFAQTEAVGCIIENK